MLSNIQINFFAGVSLVFHLLMCKSVAKEWLRKFRAKTISLKNELVSLQKMYCQLF